MTTITLEEIFSFSESELQNQLNKFEDSTKYSNKLEKLNAVIIHNFNNDNLNEKESKIVESEKYNKIIKLNLTYPEFIRKFYQQKFKKIQINIDPNLLKSWTHAKYIKTLPENNDEDSISSMTINEKYLFTGSYKIINIWSISNNNFGELITTFEAHNRYIFGLVLNEKYLFSGSYQEIKIRDISDDNLGKLVQTIKTNDEIYSLCLNEKYLFSGSYKFTQIWDINSFNLIKTLEASSDVTSICLNEKYLFIGSYGEIKIWNISDTNFAELFLNLKEYDMIYSLVLNENYLFSGTFNNIKIWDISNNNFGKLVKTIQSSDQNNSLYLKNNYLFGTNNDAEFKIWNISNFELIQQFENKIIIYRLILNDRYIFAGLKNGTVKIWEKD